MKSPEPSAEPLSSMRAGLRSIVILRGDRLRASDGAAMLAMMCAGACAPVLAERPRMAALQTISNISGPFMAKAARGALDRFTDPLGEAPEPTRVEIEEAFVKEFAVALDADADTPDRITDEAARLLLKLDGLRVAMDAAVSRRGDSALARSIVDELIIAGAQSKGARQLVGDTLLGDSLGFKEPGDPAAAEEDADDEAGSETDESGSDEPPDADEAARGAAEAAPPPAEARGLKRWFRSRRVMTGALIALATCLVAASALAAAAHLRLEDYRTEVVTERLLEASAEAVETDGALAQLLAAAAWRLDPTDKARAAMSRAAYAPAAGRFTSTRDLNFGSITFNPDGTSFATLGGDESVELWNAETMEPELLDEGGGSLTSGPLEFSPDGLMLAAGAYEAPIRLWDLRTRDLTELEVAHAVDRLVFDPLGTKLAAVGSMSSDPLDFEAEYETVVTIWELETREQISSFSVAGSATAASFDPEGEELLISTDADALLRGYEPATGDPVSELEFADGSGSAIGGFQISPRPPHDYLVCLSSCMVWRQSDGEEPSPIASIGASSGQLGFSRKGDRVFSAVAYEGIGVWDATTGARLGALAYSGVIDDVAASPDGRTAVALTGGELQRWDLDRLAGLREMRASLYPANMSMSPDWSRAVNTTPGGTEIWDVGYGVVPSEEYPEHIGLGTALSSDGSVAATLLDGETTAFELWNPESGEQIGTIDDDSDTTMLAGFSDDGSMLFASTARLDDAGDTAYAEENDVVVWDRDSGDELARVTLGGEWPTESVDVGPDGSTLLVVPVEGDPQLWDIADGRLIGELEGLESEPFEAVFSPDGGLIAAATSDGFALWDTADLAAGPTVFDTGFVSTTVEFSPDGRYLAVDESYTVDLEDEQPPRVTVLDVDSGEIVAALPINPAYSIYSQISISPEGDDLAFVTSDSITIVDIAYLRGDGYEFACEQAGRELTEGEWREYLPEFEYGSLDFCGG